VYNRFCWGCLSRSCIVSKWLMIRRPSCYGMRIGNPIQLFEWYRFLWPLTQILRSSHYSKVNISQTVRDRDGTQIKTRTPSIEWYYFQWPWVMTSNLGFKVTILFNLTWCKTLYNGSRIWSIDRCHFQWLWTTANPDFKGTTIFDTEYVSNGTR